MSLEEQNELLLRSCEELEKEATYYEGLINEIIELDAAQDNFTRKEDAIVNDKLAELQNELENYRSEVELLTNKRNQLQQLNKDLEIKLKLKLSQEEENSTNEEKDLLLKNETEAIQDQLNEINSEIDKLKVTDSELTIQLDEINLNEGVTESSLKSLKNEIFEKNKEINELECELQLLCEEIDIDNIPQISSSNTKSLFSEVADQRSEGVNELRQLKEKYHSLKTNQADAKLKLSKLTQTKQLFESRLNLCKENYEKYLQDMIYILKNKNKLFHDKLAALETNYNLNKDKHGNRKESGNKTVFDGMIATIEKSLEKVAEEKEGLSYEEMLLFEKCLSMKSQAFRIEKELLYIQNQNSNVKIIKDSLLNF